MKRVLTIAGSDSGGGAGIQADLKTFAAFGTFGMSVITAVTAQNTKGVFGIAVMFPHIIEKQLQAVISDIGTDAVKIGMLANSEIVTLVAKNIEKYSLPNVVLDPVMIAKSGDSLLSEEAITTIKERLIPLSTVITPNLPEAERLLGHPIGSEDDMKQAAIELHRLGCRNVVIKGGHLYEKIREREGNEKPEAVDIIYDGKDLVTLREEFIFSSNTHGTGCTFASAIAAGLAKGDTPHEAIMKAKIFITEAIRTAPDIGKGHGPVNHLVWMNGKSQR